MTLLFLIYLSEHFEENRTNFQGISLDYKKFMSESILDCYKLEAAALRKISPAIPITTNLMGFYKPLDYHKWADEMDFISWDNYPSNEELYSSTAMKHELMRGLKQGKPFALMEQTPSVTNWLPYNALKRPGIMRLWSYQAVAHGADTIMFFQMRRSIGACEKYHGAVIDHVGTEHTRVFRELAKLGEELKILGNKTLGARHRSNVAIYFDWENWWAIEYSAGPSVNLKYYDQLLAYYQALNTMNISVDIVCEKDSFTDYDLIIAPVLYMVKEGLDEKIRSFVKMAELLLPHFLVAT
jgi:beta-galactosidase